MLKTWEFHHPFRAEEAFQMKGKKSQKVTQLPSTFDYLDFLTAWMWMYETLI